VQQQEQEKQHHLLNTGGSLCEEAPTKRSTTPLLCYSRSSCRINTVPCANLNARTKPIDRRDCQPVPAKPGDTKSSDRRLLRIGFCHSVFPSCLSFCCTHRSLDPRSLLLKGLHRVLVDCTLCGVVLESSMAIFSTYRLRALSVIPALVLGILCHFLVAAQVVSNNSTS
jgi:hypothetical protein